MKTRSIFIALIGLVAFAPFITRAVTKTWDGSSSGLWATASNWTNNVAPVNGDGLLFPTNVARFLTTNSVGGATNLLFLGITGANYVIRSPALSITNGLTNLPPINGSNNLFAAITVRANQTWESGGKTVLTLSSNIALSTFQLTLIADGTVEALANVTGSSGSQLFKDGSGTFELDGSANSVPDFRVRDGTLRVDGVLAGGLSISNGASLIGSGTVPAFTNSGSVSPGTGGATTGVLSVSAGATKFSAGSLTFQLNGLVPGTDYDQLKVPTPPDLSGATLGIVRGAGFSPLVGDKFIIITNIGASPFTTTFVGKPEGSLQTNGSIIYTISYTNGSGNDVALTVSGYNFTGTDRTWSGAGTNGLWQNASNWVGNVAPVPGDNLIFPGGTARLTSTNDFPAASVFNSITVSNDFYILHGNEVRINNGVHGYAVGPADIHLPLTLTQQQTFSNTLCDVRFFGPINNAGHTLVFQVDDILATSLESTAILSGSGQLHKNGTGNLVLSCSNAFTGFVIVNQGVLSVRHSNGLAPGGLTTVLAGAVLDLGNNISVNEPINLVGTVHNSFGTNVLTGAISLSSTNSTVQVDTNSALTFSGVLDGVGGLVKTGPGALTLAGSSANTYTSATVVNEGTLVLNKTAGTNAIPGALTIGDGVGGNNADFVQLLASNQISNSAPITINSSGKLNLSSFDETIGALTMDGGVVDMTTGTLTLNGDVTRVASAVAAASLITGKLSLGGMNRTFTINTNPVSSEMILSGVISDGGASAGLIKTGAGHLTLSGNNTYTSPTVVVAGTLLVNGSQPGSSIMINGGTLGGTGTVGLVTSSGASPKTVSPGASPGILNCSNVALSFTTTFFVELNGTNAGVDYDQLNVSGTVSVFSAALTGTVGFTPAVGDTFKIINNNGTNDPVIDTLTFMGSGVGNGDTISLGGFPFQLFYNGGDGNDVVLTRVRPALSITNLTRLGTNVQFTALGIPGVNYVIEASTNLVSWLPVSTNIPGTNGLVTFVQTNASQFPQRFFRALTP